MAPEIAPAFARPAKGAEVAVSSVTPAYARRGEIVTVRVGGSGFVDGSAATWERNGVIDTLIEVLSTEYISTTELEATISVKDSAMLALYNVVVTRPDKKKGVATEAFEVTTAISFGTLGGSNTYTYDASNSGAIVGYASTPDSGVHAFVFTETHGIRSLGKGTASAIDDAGTTVGGFDAADALLFEFNGTSWVKTVLPSARVRSMVFDIAGEGESMIIGGSDTFKSKGQQNASSPALWKRSGDQWVLTRLRVGSDSTGDVRAVTADGAAAGNNASRATFWSSSGIGTHIGPSQTIALNINSSATMIVGQGSNSIAAYWLRNAAGTWVGPIQLPGNCQYAMAVDDAGNILAHRCPNGIRFAPVVFTASSGYTKGIMLGGLGGLGETAGARGMSRDGRIIGGQAAGQGVRWLDILAYQF